MGIKEAKEYIPNRYSFESINELLSKRRRAFDHKFITTTMSFSLGDGKIAKKLDEIWDSIQVKQTKLGKFAKLTSLLTGNLLLNNTPLLKIKKWNSYLDGVLNYAKGLNNEQ